MMWWSRDRKQQRSGADQLYVSGQTLTPNPVTSTEISLEPCGDGEGWPTREEWVGGTTGP